MSQSGCFVWFELLTPEVDRAQAFYTETLEWRIEPFQMEGSDFAYPVIKVGETGIGGFMKPPMAGIPTHWLSYLAVDDVDQAAKKFVAAGGRSLADAMDIPNIGRIQPVQDPQGAVLALFKPAYDAPQDAKGPGSVHWNELWANDPAKAAEFYSKVFGFDTQKMDTPNGTYHMLTQNGEHVGGIGNAQAQGVPPGWLQYVEVADADATVARAQKNGASALGPVMEVPDIGRFAQLRDPLGATFAVIKPARA
jgi:uncharacterized protein